MLTYITRFFLPLKQRQSYLHIVYVLLSFLLGTGYLLFLLLGFFLSLGLLFIWLGLPLALFLLLALQDLAHFERSLLRIWLKQELLPPARLKPTGTLLRRLLTLIKSATTWKNLAYFLLKALPGLFVSVVLLSIFGAALNVGIGTLAYLLNASVDLLLQQEPIPQTFFAHLTVSIIIPLGTPFADLHTLPAPLASLKLCLLALLGLLCLVSSLHLSNGVVWIWKWIAALLLGASQADLQLAEAQRQAALEHVRAEQADQKRSELIVNVSHELRTPVASIQGHVEVLLKAYENDENSSLSPEIARHYLTIVHRETLRLGALVEDLLALARTEKHELQINVDSVGVGEIVEQVYHALAQLAQRERQISLVRHIEPNLPLGLVDRQRLTQVLLNLARNAITYTPEGGIVSLALQQADAHYLVLLVSDTGLGIPADELPRIFERFYRVDTSRAQSSGGTGLGLAIVKEFVEAMGGSISVESLPGEGSTFRVLLPIAQVLDS